MNIYIVQHTAKGTYEIVVQAKDGETAKGDDSYVVASAQIPSEHYWLDSVIVEEYAPDDENAPEVELEL